MKMDLALMVAMDLTMDLDQKVEDLVLEMALAMALTMALAMALKIVLGLKMEDQMDQHLGGLQLHHLPFGIAHTPGMKLGGNQQLTGTAPTHGGFLQHLHPFGT